MSGKVEATFQGAGPDPQTAQQLAVARAYVARVNACPYQHSHTSLYCSKCGWFAESPIMTLVAEIDRHATALAAVPVQMPVFDRFYADDVVRTAPEGLEQPYIRTTDPGNGLDVYFDQASGRRIPEYEAGLKVRAKRLSDAEMAAELYRAEWTVLHHKIRAHELSERVYGTCRFADIPQADLDKVATIRRFAENTHHDAAPRFHN